MGRFDSYTEYRAYRQRMDLQRQYNAIVSAQMEMIMLAPKCPWIAVPKVPWWRLDIRIQAWMEEWDERFAGRYARS